MLLEGLFGPPLLGLVPVVASILGTGPALSSTQLILLALAVIVVMVLWIGLAVAACFHPWAYWVAVALQAALLLLGCVDVEQAIWGPNGALALVSTYYWPSLSSALSATLPAPVFISLVPLAALLGLLAPNARNAVIAAPLDPSRPTERRTVSGPGRG
jgi:hypothetical protein